MFNFFRKRDKKVKRIYLHESDRPMIRGTRVIIKDADTGKVLDEGSNSILYAGSINAALKDFCYYEYKAVDPADPSISVPSGLFLDTTDIAIPMSYSAAIYGDVSVDDLGISAEGPVCLFGVGVDGVENSMQSSQKKAVQYEGWIDPKDLVPFRMVGKDSGDVSERDRKDLYAAPVFKTAPNEVSQYECYYFKRFESTKIYTQYELNGSAIPSPANVVNATASGAVEYYNNYLINNQYSSGAEVIVEMKCRITNKECREFFELDAANPHFGENPNVSSIIICTAIPVLDGSGEITPYFKNIMPKSKRNITRELFLDNEKGLEVIYQYIY